MKAIFCPTASGRPAENVTFSIRPEFKLQDLWVGVYWKRCGNCVDLWACLLPCLPMHICWHWNDPEQ